MSAPNGTPTALDAMFPVDMEEVTRQAFATHRPMRHWRVEFTTNGRPFNWQGKATSQAAAELRARAELSESSHEFNRYNARVSACVEVPAP